MCDFMCDTLLGFVRDYRTPHYHACKLEYASWILSQDVFMTWGPNRCGVVND